MISALSHLLPSNGNDSITFEIKYQRVRQLIFILLSIISVSVFAQSRQTEYLEAKRQFTLGNYQAAKSAFQSLSDDKFFGTYSSFYFALSAYHQGEVKLATDMWKQIQIQEPDWDQNKEVDYWLASAYLDQKKYYEAFKYANRLPEEVKNTLIDGHFNGMSVSALDSAYALNPNNEIIADYLVQAIADQPYDERDYLLLDELSEKFGFSLKGNGLTLPLIKKETYSIGVVLPFMFESVERPQSVLRNKIIFDLYQGMGLAQRDLKRKNISLELFPFDTQKEREKTKEILDNESLKSADVIIGPLFSGPHEVVSDFSMKNEVTMINPLTSNSGLIGNNPFSYLFKPSYETQGRKAAEYASDKFTENKKALVFYETKRDSIVATAYRDVILKDSFFVVRFERLTRDSALQVQRDFTEQIEFRLDTLFSQNEIDSIALIPGRYVRNRVLRDEETGRILKNYKGEDKLEYYELKFKVDRDSIGHIFAATSSNLLAKNLISLVEVRSDTIGLIGYDSWLNFDLLSFDQLERIGASMISTSFFNKEDFDFKRIQRKFVEEIGEKPNEYHLQGYELVMQLGKLMKEHGKYFQRGLASGDLSKGIVMDGLQYGSYNDNQIVSVIELENLKLVNKNSQTDSILEDED